MKLIKTDQGGELNIKELKRLMRAAGLSQNKAAEKAGVSKMTMSYICRGMREPSLKCFKRLCGALGCRPEDLW